MNEKEYRDMFSQLHSSVQEEAIIMKTKPAKRFRFISVPVAAVLVLVLTAGIAFAGVYGNRIQDLVMSDNDGYELSLQGFVDSPEYKATQEWLTFEEKYDKEHKAELDAIGNDPTQWDDKYGDYGVYTQEMADKVDKICKKYDLKLHSGWQAAASNEIYDRFGKFSSDGGSGYFYEDGTFQLESDASVDGRTFPYSIRRTMKGVFDTTYIHIEDISKYEQWEYETACGETVVLALANEDGCMISNYDDCFVVVGVLSGTKIPFTDEYDTITKKSMEALADTIDFSVIGSGKKSADSTAEEATEAAEEESAKASSTDGFFEYEPVADSTALITRTYGSSFGGKVHTGIDFGAPEGADIYAVADGTATVAESDASYGNYVVIEHDNGWSTLYAHCDTIAIEDGAHVEAGEIIATVGSSGQSSGPHLHFELRGSDGTPVDPEPYLAK